MFDLCLITPELGPAAIRAQAEAALAGAIPGRVALQLRATHLSADELSELARALRAITRSAGALLLVNADLELAREVGADGVQLPERGPSVEAARARLPAGMLLGASRHDLYGIRAAAASLANFATLSPVFAVPGKGEPLGLARFGEIARASPLPLIALGGITPARACAAMRAGARGVAVIREVWDSAAPDVATARLLAAVDAGRRAEPA